MAVRSLVWIEGGVDGGWSCSLCTWRFPVPTLLTEKEAKDAYDRLAAAKFNDHTCSLAAPTAPRKESNTGLADRARGLITRGYKPKVAVELVLHELEFEFRNDPKVIEKARAEAEQFLLNIRKGAI
jgi:hypothetical protein